MNITIMQLAIIVLIAVNIIMPILYSIVITALFIHAKRDVIHLEHEFDMMEAALQKKGAVKKEKTPIGFAAGEEKG